LAEIDDLPKVPPPPKPRDDSIGTAAKLVGGGCVTFCTCISGLLLILWIITLGTVMPIMYTGMFLLLALACIIVGCLAMKYTWSGVQEASGS
jgi:hypothetical protein